MSTTSNGTKKITEATPTRTARRLTRERLRALVRELVLDGHPVPDWHSHAACAGMDEALFFPVADGGPLGIERIEQAKQVCVGCPVRNTCLADTMARESPTARYGVFGGLSAGDRGRLYTDLRTRAFPLDDASDESGAVA
ncbi:WhiB family transcriptional regulator [Actinomycetospora flava]|uniref:WhiB family transcriptional regulator n=1 Tax=Actinomycetospora flava TaxID=3129232 RepID=A0ABU8MB41_9PSEU